MPAEPLGWRPVGVAKPSVPGLAAMAEPVSGLVVRGMEPIPLLLAGGVGSIPLPVVSGLGSLPRWFLNGVEPIPLLLAGGRRFGAGLAAAAPFGNGRRGDRPLAVAGHGLASYRQMM